MSSSTQQLKRTFDVIVYGATGYTGKRVAQYLIQTYHKQVKVALAGRSQDKLVAVAEELFEGGSKAAKDHVLVASIEDHAGLVEILSQGRIVLACIGPYRHVGEPVVKAAIEAKTDYLDLCGEPQFYDDMLVKYEKSARQANVLIVHATAFDCVPAELSAAFVSRQLRQQFPEAPHVTGIEIVHTLEGCVCAHETTYHAAVDGFHAAMTGELKKSRMAVKEAFPDIPKRARRPSHWPDLPIPPGAMFPHYHEYTNRYIVRFMGADAAALLASDRYLRLRQQQVKDDDDKKDDSAALDTTYTTIPPAPKISVCFGVQNFGSACTILTYGTVFMTLTQTKWGCKMLHQHPASFSAGVFRKGSGPTDEELEEGSFTTYAVAYGVNPEEQVVRSVCRGPEPGYIATSRMMVALAMTVLQHRKELPFQGGVMLPGALFGEFQPAYDQLVQEGITFQEEKVVKKPTTPEESTTTTTAAAGASIKED